MSQAARNIPALTGIRAIAAGIVLALHTELQLPAGSTAAFPFFERGYLGVDLFFVLSGYIITHVYFDSFARREPGAFRVFLWHRLIRLYPVHLAILAVLVAMVAVAVRLGLPFRSGESWDTPELIWQVLLLHAWGLTDRPAWNAPSWSVSAELFAYLLFPLVAAALLAVRRAALGIAIGFAALAAMALVFHWRAQSLADWLHGGALVRVAAEFLCGAALCRAAALAEAAGTSWRHADAMGFAAFVLFFAGAWIAASDFLLVAFLAVAILGAAKSQGALERLLANRAMVWLGEISYSVYMVHLPVLLVLHRLFGRMGFAEWGTAGKALAYLAAIGIVVAAAAALFYTVERPVRQRLRDAAGPRTAARPAG